MVMYLCRGGGRGDVVFYASVSLGTWMKILGVHVARWHIHFVSLMRSLSMSGYRGLKMGLRKRHVLCRV